MLWNAECVRVEKLPSKEHPLITRQLVIPTQKVETAWLEEPRSTGSLHTLSSG